MHGNLSKKADVFSFGVVVLELISGQKNSSFDRDPDSGNLIEWVRRLDSPCRIGTMVLKGYKKVPDIQKLSNLYILRASFICRLGLVSFMSKASCS